MRRAGPIAAWVGVAGLLAAVLCTSGGCGDKAVGVDACRKIEFARCRFVVACNIGVGTRRSDSTSPVDDCDRYYDDACLHGFASGSDPGDAVTQKCVDAINAAKDCTIIVNPETAPECAFLVPEAGVAEASDTTEAGDDAAAE